MPIIKNHLFLSMMFQTIISVAIQKQRILSLLIQNMKNIPVTLVILWTIGIGEQQLSYGIHQIKFR
ncbi:hypothetical protein CCS41_11000 [Candidatus Fukatsuia symbiotica]|uniref:Uncharacterized protein n=1 Tax=Candidatus Fukatsuia symbiotica TaxID=1878942 RepID=A0A2U8I6T0_9GAMM|nr:hypothetical protein CCS41_11000 [Candidatus Fukatsuia symbiotica]